MIKAQSLLPISYIQATVLPLKRKAALCISVRAKPIFHTSAVTLSYKFSPRSSADFTRFRWILPTKIGFNRKSRSRECMHIDSFIHNTTDLVKNAYIIYQCLE